MKTIKEHWTLVKSDMEGKIPPELIKDLAKPSFYAGVIACHNLHLQALTSKNKANVVQIQKEIDLYYKYLKQQMDQANDQTKSNGNTVI